MLFIFLLSRRSRSKSRHLLWRQEYKAWALDYMDSGVWEALSNDLVEKVIALLPLPSLFKARAVCKHWNSFIFSTKFHDIRADSISWSDLSFQESYLLVFLSVGSSITCTAYSSVLNRWLSMPSITCLPSRAKDVVAGEHIYFQHNQFNRKIRAPL